MLPRLCDCMIPILQLRPGLATFEILAEALAVCPSGCAMRLAKYSGISLLCDAMGAHGRADNSTPGCILQCISHVVLSIKKTTQQDRNALQNRNFYEICLNHPRGRGFVAGPLRVIVEQLCDENACYSDFAARMLIWCVQRAAAADNALAVSAGLQLAIVAVQIEDTMQPQRCHSILCPIDGILSVFDVALAGVDCILELVKFVLTLLSADAQAAAYLFEVRTEWQWIVEWLAMVPERVVREEMLGRWKQIVTCYDIALESSPEVSYLEFEADSPKSQPCGHESVVKSSFEDIQN